MKEESRKKYCGIDVSADTLDVCYQAEGDSLLSFQVTNDKKGFQKIIKTCGKDYHYVMESTVFIMLD
ncbi:MAG: IS110 family transposase [Brumimicrobium sp.]|nr:IS110 family transposase [Brumimicrobium sp.]